ncbi:MAG: tRNA uridine-5-carboxymethylaminomethyl(34) synthesis GTPase MnmE, partial [Erysipelotrichaceae bacterium]|nr:tRNA uridine-5-carboxymethylaminomethyl(34) synthesis GTPase MnmE [Erysipelotrichaceae bacterium]
LIVYNKADLVKRKEVLSISALNKDIKPLINAIQQMFETQMMVIDANILNNERQIALSKQAKQALDQAILAIDQDMELDIVLIDIENAYDHLRSILYQVQDGDLLDTLFSNFCLGK